MSDPADRAHLEENLQSVRRRLEEACRRSGRDPRAVQLLPVTKGQPAERVRELHALGPAAFGENRVQEALAKKAQLPPGCVWHLVGHLQRNKARHAAEAFALIHSVDSERLAAALDAEGARLGRPVAVLLEANLTGEPDKTGCPEGGFEALAASARAKAGLSVLGLMTMAREGGGDAARSVFRRLREWAGRIWPEGRTDAGPPVLSMGMSGDFEIAVEEGATLVRIGSALFRGVGREAGPGPV